MSMKSSSSAIRPTETAVVQALPNMPSDSYFTLEVFLVGGLSILVCACAWLFFDKSVPLATISNFAFAAAFAVNHPHFLSSYILMYQDFRKNILKKNRYFFSAVIVPVLLLGLMAYTLHSTDKVLMGHIITSMYFLVGWHYVKQIFGFVIVTSAHRKNYYTAFERKLLLCNLFSIWFLSFLGSHIGNSSFDFYGIPHYSLNLPGWMMQVDQFVLAFSFLSVIYLHIKKYIETGVKPAPPAVASLAALYVWYIPAMAHPGFAYMIPFFHSLQYLTFVWLYKKNQVCDEIKELKGSEWRKNWLQKFAGFMLGAFVLGALAFEFVPKFLDKLNLIPAGSMGSAPFLAAFLLFINIHHYFIDNTIWRSDNPDVKAHLFQLIPKKN